MCCAAPAGEANSLLLLIGSLKEHVVPTLQIYADSGVRYAVTL